MKFVRFILIVLFFSAVIVSCQKDQQLDALVTKTSSRSDTSNTSGNFMAVSGTLNIIVGDSTYNFDASEDSIAFINANIDSNKYFGITAINKQHTMSFGISSPGFATSDLVNPVAGSQLLFSVAGKHGIQYTLSKDVDPKAINKISLTQYMQDSILTKGTFTTFMTNKEDTGGVVTNKVKGSFNLRIK
jgi:hypothetical protein